MINKIPYLHSKSDDFLVFYKPPFWSCNAPIYEIDDRRVLDSFETATRNFPTWVAKYMKDNFIIDIETPTDQELPAICHWRYGSKSDRDEG